jgi:hypothetical protein
MSEVPLYGTLLGGGAGFPSLQMIRIVGHIFKKRTILKLALLSRKACIRCGDCMPNPQP